MADTPEIDQETFDRLVAEGQPERVARAKAKAAAVRKAKQAERADAASGGDATASGPAEDPDAIAQKVYDDLIAEGQPERVARAKSKAAKVRAEKKASSAPAAKPAAAAASSGGGGGGGGGVAAPARPAARTSGNGGGNGHGVPLTPEERQQRVAAALAAKGGGPHARTGGENTKFSGQEHTHRLLAMVPPTGIQQIRGKQEDKVYTWPHLITAELLALLAVTAFLTLFSAFAPAPLRELANPNVSPNPAKAPWYFLGLQELLRYFHPMIAGVTIPGIVGLVGLMTFPYLDKNPSVKPENRKFAYVLFTLFLMGSGVLTMAGSFFRGPGFNWTWPWTDGIWFTL